MTSPFGFLLPPLPPLVPPNLQAQTISPAQLAYTFPAASIGSHICVFLLPGQTLPAGSAAALYIQFPGQADFKFLGALGDGKESAVFRVAGLKTNPATSNGAFPGTGAGTGTTATNGGEVDMDADNDGTAASGANSNTVEGNVTIGVSLEPIEEVAAKVTAQKAASQTNGTTTTAAAGSSSSTGGTMGLGLSSPSIPSPLSPLSSTMPGNALVRRTAVSAQGTGSPHLNSPQLNQGQALQQPSTKILAQRIIKNAFNFLASFEGGTGMVPIKAFEGWWQKFERRVENDPGFLEREQD